MGSQSSLVSSPVAPASALEPSNMELTLRILTWDEVDALIEGLAFIETEEGLSPIVLPLPSLDSDDVTKNERKME